MIKIKIFLVSLLISVFSLFLIIFFFHFVLGCTAFNLTINISEASYDFVCLTNDEITDLLIDSLLIEESHLNSTFHQNCSYDFHTCRTKFDCESIGMQWFVDYYDGFYEGYCYYPCSSERPYLCTTKEDCDNVMGFWNPIYRNCDLPCSEINPYSCMTKESCLSSGNVWIEDTKSNYCEFPCSKKNSVMCTEQDVCESADGQWLIWAFEEEEHPYCEFL